MDYIKGGTCLLNDTHTF